MAPAKRNRRATLELARKLAANGHVRSARKLVREELRDDTRPIPAIEVKRTVVTRG